MGDVWAQVAELEPAMQTRLADVLEARGAESQQQQMRSAFIEAIDVPEGAGILDVGCGTGVLTRALIRESRVDSVIGVDLAPTLIEKARELAGDEPNLRFEQADAGLLPFEDGSFDVVVFDSTFSHLPDPATALAEAFRVLRPTGSLAVFDGDYATATVALGDHDPLQVCVDAMMAGSVTDRRVMRRLPKLASEGGFVELRQGSYGFVESGEGAYMLTVVDRGADMLYASGSIGEEAMQAFKAEARRRVSAGEFFGHIAYVSLIARKSAA